MKRKIYSVIIFIMLLLILPLKTNALEYTSQTLEEACESEDIEFVHPNYTESSKKINVYLFRGSGCSHCHDFLEYLESIVEEDGQYFNVVSYEIWEDTNNDSLMTKALEFMGDSTDSGVPYIVIGNKSWVGYADSIKDEILSAIKTQYESETKFDLLEQLNVETPKTTSSDNNGLIVLILVFLVLFDGFLLYKTIKDKKETDAKINILEQKNTPTQKTKAKNNKK